MITEKDSGHATGKHLCSLSIAEGAENTDSEKDLDAPMEEIGGNWKLEIGRQESRCLEREAHRAPACPSF